MFLKTTVLLLFVLATVSSVKAQTVIVSKVNETAPSCDSTEIAFASDTQAPMWVEKLWLKANNNRTATRMLFNDLCRRRPGALFLLGDVVNLGYSNAQWRPMDRYLQSLRDKGVQVHAILGNHEVMGRPAAGERKFQERFPEHVRTGYVQIVDSVAVVLLNSNFKSLTEDEDRLQLEWYADTLKKLNANPEVQYIVVGCHHSPYTNSKIVGASHAVQQRFVKDFLATPKARLFLSGHSHNYEHFHISGKDFMVIGGGGGIHQPLRPNSDDMNDTAPDYKPAFHYLTIKRQKDHLVVTSHELTGDFTAFNDGRSVAIRHETEKVLVVSAQQKTEATTASGPMK
ncbi:MAG: metallophosphoesterase [Chitinophagaceae bacterium]|nr:MAG: metallophosphoesterase [Chitinophagaceae bacterium]